MPNQKETMPYNAILQWAHNNFVSIHGSNERSTLWRASIRRSWAPRKL